MVSGSSGARLRTEGQQCMVLVTITSNDCCSAAIGSGDVMQKRLLAKDASNDFLLISEIEAVSMTYGFDCFDCQRLSARCPPFPACIRCSSAIFMHLSGGSLAMFWRR
mmetsp:Transcript_117004/g.225707  ORF Transcript_117004/g.225707 Transcript_117004/m.225707 type:complete len:108 (+) Transcript_117004:237-560(+)